VQTSIGFQNVKRPIAGKISLVQWKKRAKRHDVTQCSIFAALQSPAVCDIFGGNERNEGQNNGNAG
jgi:hypothetical protein